MLPARGGHRDRGREWGVGVGVEVSQAAQVQCPKKQQDSAELCEWLLTPAGVVMGKPNSAALPDHAILENVGKFMCTHLYLNVDKKLKQF